MKFHNNNNNKTPVKEGEESVPGSENLRITT
jgi:hypothetical protein